MGVSIGGGDLVFFLFLVPDFPFPPPPALLFFFRRRGPSSFGADMIQSLSNASADVIRSPTSTVNIALIRILASSEMCDQYLRWNENSPYRIRSRQSSPSPRKGRYPPNKIKKTTPKLQMSHSTSYCGLCSMISGATKPSVPHTVVNEFGCNTFLAWPKSVSLMCPVSLTTTFSGLRQ